MRPSPNSTERIWHMASSKKEPVQHGRESGKGCQKDGTVSLFMDDAGKNMTWIVICPNWEEKIHVNKPHGWSLPLNQLAKVANHYSEPVIECIVCGHKFSLQQGVMEAFSATIPFVIHDFQYNARESGEVELTIGQLKTIMFSDPFEDIPEVYLTPLEKAVAAVPGRITNSQFSIFSCDSGTGSETRKISWAAFGNRGYAAIPIWRKLISNSKRHELRKDFRSELVELESAFEVFAGEYLGKRLRTKLKDETVSWLLKRSIEEQLKVGFIELKGKPLGRLEPTAYRKWQEHAKQLRDSVVHRGISVTDKQAREARRDVFDLITRVDPLTIDFFRVQMEKIRLNHPNVTFGTAIIKGTK